MELEHFLGGNCEGSKNFFQTGIMPEGVNEAIIVLIPKSDDHKRVSDFWPISLCNVIYKIVAKCLINRLRTILDEIISSSQSAFVPGRLIIDNALVASGKVISCLPFCFSLLPTVFLYYLSRV